MAIPKVGDEVLYHADDRWYAADVTVSRPSGTLTLLYEEGSLIAQHGAHIHGWLTYEEAAQYAQDHAMA
jgi:hypothetical protein